MLPLVTNSSPDHIHTLNTGHRHWFSRHTHTHKYSPTIFQTHH